MKINRALAAFLLLCIPDTLLLSTTAWSQVMPASLAPPVVRKIEPPNWWTKFTPELTLLLTGENLAGVRVTSVIKNLTVASSEASANGHYLFMHLKVSRSLHAGTARLELRTSAGSTTVQLPILTRADSRGRFEGFSQNDVIYLIMPDRFADSDASNDQPPGSTGTYDRSQPMAYHGGDLRGIRQHLPYLHDLGVTTLWLTPVWKNTDSDYHGYHVMDFYAIDDHMGSLSEYQGLVADAHKLGMKVLIDYVANHTGPKNAWANDPPTPTWLHGTPEHHLAPSYSFNGLADPHASPRQYRATLEGWFVNKLPDINPDDPKLADYLAQNALWWTEIAQLDGFRIDTFPYSSRKFWGGWHERLHEVYPRLDSIGEVADGDATITSFFEGGRKQFDGVDSGVSTVFDFPLESALRDVINRGQPMVRLVDVLRRDALYPHPETLVTFFGNHDHKRFISEDGSSPAKLKAAFSLLLTLRGIPQIYSGDEIGMPGGDDPDNRRDFPGGFPGDRRDAFTAAGRTPEQQDIFAHVQSLLALRRAHPALRTGKQQHIGWDDTYYAFLRELPEEKLLVVYNNSASARDLKIPVTDTPLASATQFESLFGQTTAQGSEGEVRVTLPAQSLAVFRVR
jgi:glycosidase